MATFNLLSGRSPGAAFDVGLFTGAVRALDADLLALQEVDRDQERWVAPTSPRSRPRPRAPWPGGSSRPWSVPPGGWVRASAAPPARPTGSRSSAATR